ncbi:MAG: hypothetical protein IPL29_02350 [Propionivibrio sp.]|nr:hypothetical protein [Propionivibrio sp.]
MLALLLSGCASLQNAGTAEYSVKPFVDTAGRVLCCDVTVKNGKEIAFLDAHIEKRGDDYTVDLKERGVKAFEGQAISAAAMGAVLTSVQRAALASALLPLMPALLPALARRWLLRASVPLRWAPPGPLPPTGRCRNEPL